MFPAQARSDRALKANAPPADPLVMRRSPATVVIPVWNAWSTTQACLHSLRATLGVHDEVIVVDNGSTDDTPQHIKQFPWVTLLTSDTNRGFGSGCNLGASEAHHPYIVFLNNDTVLYGRWLDPLIAAMDADPAIGATGPRSNFVSGCQQVEYATYTSPAAMRQFARQWAAEHRGKQSQTQRLVGFCIAVRRSIFAELAGFDEQYGIGGYEDDDLCRRILAKGYRLVVCEESFVHHEGHVTFTANNLDWFQQQQENQGRYLQGAHAQPLATSSSTLLAGDETEPPVSARGAAERSTEPLRANSHQTSPTTCFQSPSRPAASIIIPCFNRADLTLQCLESLVGSTEPGNYQVIIVDNGSTDNTPALQRLARRNFVVLRNSRNLGFARACNQGAAAADGTHLVFLNNDTVASPGWLSALLQPFDEDNTIGIVGARLLFPDGTIQHAGMTIDIHPETGEVHGTLLHYRAQADDPTVLLPQFVDLVAGAAMAVRRQVWDQVGGFHEGYWNGNEDVDFCLTARSLGWTVLYQPNSVLVHHESQSGPERWTGYARNVELLTTRWASRLGASVVRSSPSA